MRIGALVKQSFIDWEGKIVAVIFTKGCNFRCGYCHNPELVLPELFNRSSDISEKEIFDFLKSKQSWLDGVVITGGEPTLHPDLEDFIRLIKAINFSVKLDTNGTNPSILKKLIQENLVDYVAMDIKNVLEHDQYNKVANCNYTDLVNRILQSIEILKKSSIGYQLRTTVIPEIHTKEIIDRLKSEFSYCNYRLQEYREGVTVDSF